MATLKLKKASPSSTEPRPARSPVRGQGSAPRKRPTLPEAQALRAEREARYQEQLRQRFGDKPPQSFNRREEPGAFDAPRQRGASQQPQTPAVRARPARSPDADPRGQRPVSPDRPRPPPRRQVEDRRQVPARQRGPHEPGDHDEPRHAEIPGSMRLSKRMSELGIASRREADEWIAKGWVRVDGQVVNELGSRVVLGQHITVDAKAKFQQAQKVTVLLNKLVGFVSGQAEDGYEPAVVLVTPQNQWREDRSGTRFLREHLRGLAPAGRLDIDSVGLLVLTQDGRIAKQLIGEDSETEKEYLVRVQTVDGNPLPQRSLALLNHGLELDGEALRPSSSSVLARLIHAGALRCFSAAALNASAAPRLSPLR